MDLNGLMIYMHFYGLPVSVASVQLPISMATRRITLEIPFVLVTYSQFSNSMAIEEVYGFWANFYLENQEPTAL